MPTMAAVAIYAPFAVITAAVFVIELFRRFKRHEDYLFTVFCLCIAFWFISEMAGLLTGQIAYLRFLSNFKLIFVGYIPPILLLFVLRFYKVTLGKYEHLVQRLLFALPTLNIAVILTSGFHTLMVDVDVVSLFPYREFSLIWGSWFWVHTVYSYIVSMMIVMVVVLRHFRMPRFYRMPSTLMSCGILLTLVGNIITLMQLLPPVIDPTLISCSLSLILFDLAIINNNKSRFVHFSHKHVYHYLQEFILILDENQRVLEWNRPAERWFASHGIELKDSGFQDILNAMLSIEGAEQKELEGEEGINICLLSGDFPVVLNLRLHKITDAHEDVIGWIAVFADITQTWMLIEKLEEKAGVDSLTGIPNHMAYIGAKKRLDTPQHLPLSVIMCDANGLKEVNDTLGHQYGDLLLKIIAEILDKVCTKQNFVARIGGDEFICLLRWTTEQDAERVVARIRQAIAELKPYPFTTSIAMGVATKFHPEEDLEELIVRADIQMYQDKRRFKEQQSHGGGAPLPASIAN